MAVRAECQPRTVTTGRYTATVTKDRCRKPCHSRRWAEVDVGGTARVSPVSAAGPLGAVSHWRISGAGFAGPTPAPTPAAATGRRATGVDKQHKTNASIKGGGGAGGVQQDVPRGVDTKRVRAAGCSFRAQQRARSTGPQTATSKARHNVRASTTSTCVHPKQTQ
jgi:hypothetical protein